MFLFALLAATVVGINAQCGGSLTGDSGSINSPNYPNNYPGDSNCEWIVTASSGKVITVSFQAFTMEGRVSSSGICEYDYVYIYDTGKQSATFYCGTDTPSDFTTEGNSMRIGFVSDSSQHYSGFLLNYVAANPGEEPTVPTQGPITTTPSSSDACGGTFTGQTGSLTSPSYPNNYANDLNCIYNINAAQGPLLIQFSDFDVEASSCSYDYLEIRDGPSSSSPSLGKFCGSTSPGTVSATGSQIYMSFVTDSSVNKRGWSLSWSLASCSDFGGLCSTTCSADGPGEWDYPCPDASQKCCKPDVFPRECGERKVSVRAGNPKIVGGQEATPHTWPWQASLQSGTFHYCGATLIAAQWVVTASHCVVDETSTTVVLGEHNRNTNEGNEVRVASSMIITHEAYQAGAPYPNDIALIKLQTPVTFNDYVQPACIPDDPDWPVTTEMGCYITGWGDTKNTGDNKLLQELMVPIPSREQCGAKWGSSYILDTHICLGDGRTGACNGDSGGPLNCPKDGKWWLAGATSWGYRGCEEPDYPDVYTRISKYVDWITEKISANSG